MNLITCTRRLEIDAGHRLAAHESKCKNVHGHRYAFEITCTAGQLDAIGRVIDFSEIKRLVGGWLDDNWDHGFIYERGDKIGDIIAHSSKAYQLDASPTIENMTWHLFMQAEHLLGAVGIHVVRVRGYETPNCYAEASR